MEKALFVVPLADLERGPKEVTWTVPAAWLRRTLEQTEATPRHDGELRVELSKSGRQVMVRGGLRAALSMPCVRTLEPVDVDVNTDIFLLLHPNEAAEIGAKRVRPSARKAKPKAAAEPAKKAAEPAKKKKGWTDDPELPEEEAAHDTYDGEKVELDRFVREFILLELPMMPMQKGLRDDPDPAIARAPDTKGEAPVDPRLAPLLAIASKLRQNKE